MKKLLYIMASCLALVGLPSCLGDDEPGDENNEWRELNDQWMLTKAAEKDAAGNPVYERIGCSWDPNAYVLMRWHNDRSLTEDKLSPISTSTVDMRYEVRTIDDKEVDDSHSSANPAPGVYRTRLNNTISGWMIAVSQMHVGDTCTILIPYNQAYGSVSYKGLRPYSDLVFNVRLVDIPAYEKPI